jgi:hypothetical protein
MITQPSTLITQPNPQPWFTVKQIADHFGESKPTARARAEREGWLCRQRGNKTEYFLPESIAVAVNGHSDPTPASGPSVSLSVSYAATSLSDGARQRADTKAEAVAFLKDLLAKGNPVEFSLAATTVQFSPRIKCSPRTLRDWFARYERLGLNGLVDQKQGNSGRKSAASYLTEEQILRGRAIAVEKGSTARAYRELAARSDLSAGARDYVHLAHCSKSHVPKSIRDSLRVSESAKDLLQGPRKVRLDGRHPTFDYSDVKAGDWWTSDDMTANVICWMPFPNARGFILGRPQVLPILDIGSGRWLMVSVIMRKTMAYNADDIWGLFGDAFDQIGLPNRGFVLEGGSWQSRKVVGAQVTDPAIGSATGLHNDDRIGGLKALGLQVIHAQLPTGKVEIEAAFHRFQCEVDAFPGYVGREQRRDQPEWVKAALRDCGNGTAHPRQFFPELSQFTEHAQTCMENLNHERQDGKLLRGMSPLEKWADDAPQLNRLSDEYRWLYRSAKNVSKVTRNGVRVTQGTGANQEVYYWDNPEALTQWSGTQVVVMWNDRNPLADALILHGVTRQFLCVAKRVDALKRFGATKEEFATAHARKALEMKVARQEIRAIQPHLARSQKLIGAEVATAESNRLRDEYHGATERQEAQARLLADNERAIRQVTLTAEDMAAVTTNERPPADEPVDVEEFSHLFKD